MKYKGKNGICSRITHLNSDTSPTVVSKIREVTIDLTSHGQQHAKENFGSETAYREITWNTKRNQ